MAKLKGGSAIAGDLIVEGGISAITLNSITVIPSAGSTLTVAPGLAVTVNASITIDDITNQHVLIATGAQTIGSEAQLAITRGGTGAGDIVTARDNLDIFSRAETSDEAAALAIALS